MALVVTITPDGELLSLDEAKRHLRLYDGSLDDEVTSLIRAARDDCERETGRTFRTAVTRTLKLDRWWSANWTRDWQNAPYGDSPYGNEQRCGPVTAFATRDGSLRLPYPPLIAVGSITYYDVANAQQTLSSSNYIVEPSTDGWGRISWTVDATFPGLYVRPDAVTVTFTTGYADATAIPPVALQAMKMKLTELWGSGTENEIKAAVDCYKRLASKVDATSYA